MTRGPRAGIATGGEGARLDSARPMGENGGVNERPEGPVVPASSPDSHRSPLSAESAEPLNDSSQVSEEQVTPVLTPSQAKRANQTLKGMIISVLLTVAVAVPVILINPPNKAETYRDPVDLVQVASQAATDADFTPWAPELPEGDYVNFARWITKNVDGIKYWEFGVVTAEDKFVYVRQSAESNPSWLAAVTENAAPAGTHSVDGTAWELREREKNQVLIGTRGDSTVVLSSDSGIEALDELARLAQR
ncbi:DUF4245 domain-containing protein [Paeniglutamicibacter gangotriensis]|uniref:DUF4245 domain-containing protein n=1 Tax=Paeniglutamicibacter gangotriensis TaxID=254787 RepID=A0A5B0EI43_9MICC|nr:DUF4245 domain-containing protein [Paeniglutamicibacter gangotriensis]